MILVQIKIHAYIRNANDWSTLGDETYLDVQTTNNFIKPLQYKFTSA